MPSSLNDLIDTALAGWTEEQWCQADSALNADGLYVNPCSPDAARWCSLGRIWKFSDSNLTLEHELYRRCEALTGETVEIFNDTHTFAQVRTMLESLKEPTDDDQR